MVILIAEDSDVARKSVKLFLEAFIDGVEVLDAADGKQAMEIFELREKDIDIVVTDNDMPVMTGLELSEKIKARSNIPIILQSAGAKPQNHKADIFLYKLEKNSPQVLLEAINRLYKEGNQHEHS